MKTSQILLFLALFITSFAFSSFGNEKESLLQELDKLHKGEYDRREKVGFYEHFPNSSGLSPGSPLVLWDIRPSIEGPSCQNPGFIFNFSSYVASMTEIQNYFDNALRSAMLGAGLALIEETFPELSTMIKHFNSIAWQKKKLDAFSCQGMLDKMNDEGILTSKRAYVSCVEEETKSGTKRDDAEIQCSDKLTKVYDFLGYSPGPVANFNLNQSTLNFAKRMRDTNNSKDIPSDTTLDEIASIIGEVEVTTDGKETSRRESFVRWLAKYQDSVVKDIESLIGICKNTQEFSDQKEQDPTKDATCEIVPSIVRAKNNLTIKYPYTKDAVDLISPVEIQSLANRNPRLLTFLVESYAADITLIKAEYLVANWENIVTLAKSLDGSDEYHKIYAIGLDNLQAQIDMFKMQQRHKMRVYKMRSNIDFSKPVNFLETNWE